MTNSSSFNYILEVLEATQCTKITRLSQFAAESPASKVAHLQNCGSGVIFVRCVTSKAFYPHAMAWLRFNLLSFILMIFNGLHNSFSMWLSKDFDKKY